MRVFRIETRIGDGPYRSIDCNPWASGALADGGGEDERRPGPISDIGGWLDDMPPETTLFGFASIPQLCAWWNVDELTSVQSACDGPLFVVEWEARRVKQGAKQLAFDTVEARLVERLPLPTFIARERAAK